MTANGTGTAGSGPTEAVRPEIVEFTELPSLGRLYANAAADAARKALRRGGASRHTLLPAARHHAATVHPVAAGLLDYQHLLRESARDVLPAGYIHALAFPLSMSVLGREDFPLPLLGMIHTRNRVEYRTPLRVDDILEITAWTENLAGHRAGTSADAVVEVRRAGEEQLAWRGVSSYLAKGVFLPGLDTPEALQGGEREDFRASPPTAQWRLGSDAGRAYAGVSGDFNPIHLSALSARALGLKRSIAHGMYLASRALAEVGTAKGDSFLWEVEFEAPVFLPSSVSVNITDTRDPSGAWQRADFQGWSARTGRRHFHGSVGRL